MKESFREENHFNMTELDLYFMFGYLRKKEINKQTTKENISQ